MKFNTAIPLLVAGAFANPIQNRQEVVPPKDQVTIQAVTVNGSGCPPGSVQASLNDAKTVMTILFSKYEATIGPQSTSRADARRNCQVNLKLRYPSGYQYSVAGVITRGYADIDAGVTGEMVSVYYFSGQLESASSKAQINGPHHAGYSKEDKINIESAVWSPCGEQGMANIKTDIRLFSNNPNAGGLLTVDSIDTRFDAKIQYKFNWRQQAGCQNGGRRTPAVDSLIGENMDVTDSTLHLEDTSSFDSGFDASY